MGNVKEYTEDMISTMPQFPDAYRFRPKVFIQDVGHYGMMHLVKEVFTNSTDEIQSGFGKVINVTIDLKSDPHGPRFTVEDDARGIPLGKLKDSVSVSNTSGKYGDIEGQQSGAYGACGGLNGLGNKVVYAVSRNFVATSHRDGEAWTVKYDKGINQVKGDGVIRKKYKGKTGTTISYTPDVTVLRDVDIKDKYREYFTYFEIMSYVNAGAVINFKWGDDKVVKFYHPGGVTQYFNKVIKEKNIKLLGATGIFRYHPKDDVYYDIAFGFTKGTSGVLSYMNGIYTVEGGEHVDSFTGDAIRHLTASLNKGGFIPKNLANKVKITGRDICESMYVIIIAGKVNPDFDTQVKSKFTSPDYRPKVATSLKDNMLKWIKENPNTITKLGQHTALLAKVRYENANNKKKALAAGGSKQDLFRSVDITKFTDCNKHDPERAELYLTEGDSAGAGAIGARNYDYQAVFALRGKVKNVTKTDELSDELLTLIKILGVGTPKDKDISKLRYKRIIILTDADVDGYHISSLILVFFHKYYPELIENGNIFVAKPPLYVIQNKGDSKNVYINNSEQLNNILCERAMRVFDLIDHNDKVVNPAVAKYYYKYLPDYSDMLEMSAIKVGIHDTLLLEGICMCFSDIMKGKFKTIEKAYGYTVNSHEILPDGTRLVSFGKGYDYFPVRIDRDFLDNIVRPIVSFISEKIKLCRMRLRGRATGTIYSGFYYNQGKLIHNSLFEGGTDVRRDKGLGSSETEDLRVTSMDPATRYIIQISIRDRIEAEEWMEILFTNSIEKKEMYLANQ